MRREPEYDGGTVCLGFAIIYGLVVFWMLAVALWGVM